MGAVTKEERNASEKILLTVSWGKEVMQPLQYHPIEIGPYQMTKYVEHSDAAVTATEMSAEMERMAEEEFQRKIEGFISRVKRLREKIRENKRG